MVLDPLRTRLRLGLIGLAFGDRVKKAFQINEVRQEYYHYCQLVLYERTHIRGIKAQDHAESLLPSRGLAASQPCSP